MTKIAEPVVDVNGVSHIASGVYIKGDIISPCDVRIDGRTEGKIQCAGRLVVGEGAELKGTVLCDLMDMWGSMEGDIFVRDTLSMKSGSSVSGSLNIRRLQVEMGAAINGSCHMIEEAEFDKLVRKDDAVHDSQDL